MLEGATPDVARGRLPSSVIVRDFGRRLVAVPEPLPRAGRRSPDAAAQRQAYCAPHYLDFFQEKALSVA